MKYLFIFSMMFFIPFLAFSQENLSSKNKKALREYAEGMTFLDGYKYQEAEKAFIKSIELDKKFIEAYIMLATLYEEQKKYSESLEYYDKSFQLDEKFYPKNFFYAGNLALKIGEYEKALSYFNSFLNSKAVMPASKIQADRAIKVCKFAIDQIKNPKDFNPKSIGSGINTEKSEYMPVLTADESTIIFTKELEHPETTNPSGLQEDFYISKYVDGEWTVAVPLSNNLNTPGNEGAHTISPDGKTIYFTACDRKDGKGSCDIYMSKWKNGDWDTPVNVSEINSRFWDSQPSISPDGKTLYFTSSRSGNIDIYVTYLNDNGKWSTPTPLPKNINTPDEDMSPFIHPDGKTLYFASSGHIGMGGLDIFYTKLNDDSTWTDPVNIGYPINTYKDEAFLFVSASGEKAYFASGELNENNMDIFYFDLYKEARPDAVTYLKGVVTDMKTQNPIVASFELTDLKSGKIIANSNSDSQGAFLLCIPTGRDYMLNVSKEKYLFYSENFNLDGIHSKTEPFLKNIALQPVSTGEIVVLNNIFFDTDKYDLKEESFIELEKLKTLLLNNPQMKIEIRGHTDNTGSKQHNQILSENRAKTVVNYLISKGIKPERIQSKGYGDTIPRATNDTPEGRALNRRTEFKVIGL
ncbi:MAG: OmpA family protein [Bacteroidales bacterium]|nr:OmpA family protein [Bacteroidales bacterium]